MHTKIEKLKEFQERLWADENAEILGNPIIREGISEEDIAYNQSVLSEFSEKYWNKGSCVFKEVFESKCNDFDSFIEGSYRLEDSGGNILIYASFDGSTLVGTPREKMLDENNVIEMVVALMPKAYSLTWGIGSSTYALRTSANYSNIITLKEDKTITMQGGYVYDTISDEFTKYSNESSKEEMFEDLSDLSKIYAKSVLGIDIKTPDDMMKAFDKLEPVANTSTTQFKFTRIDGIMEGFKSNRSFFSPLVNKPQPLNFSTYAVTGEYFGLVLKKEDDNDLFGLENSRVVLYSSKSSYSPAFNFTDTIGVFDLFKTSTDKKAGRSRLLADNVYPKNGILYVKSPDNDYISDSDKNLYEIVAEGNSKASLSSLSKAMYTINDDPKRIMMTAKMRTQMVNVLGGKSETPARIVFGDFEGFNYGDSIIVSKSFAKKMESVKRYSILAKSSIVRKLNHMNKTVGSYLNYKEFYSLTRKHQFANLVDIKIVDIDGKTITFEGVSPLNVGDKMTNLHGSKGTVGLILPDEDMPYIVNDMGVNMPAGPADIILSGLSIFKRKSMGQLFEAFAMATGISDGTDSISATCEKYPDLIKEYSEKSVVRFQGKESIMPIGINLILRLHHDSASKISKSSYATNPNNLLRFAEMESLNLLSRGKNEIMKEFHFRSPVRNNVTNKMILDLQETGHFEHNPGNQPVAEMFKALGIQISSDSISKSMPTNNYEVYGEDEEEE